MSTICGGQLAGMFRGLSALEFSFLFDPDDGGGDWV